MVSIFDDETECPFCNRVLKVRRMQTHFKETLLVTNDCECGAKENEIELFLNGGRSGKRFNVERGYLNVAMKKQRV